ncbi:SDR family oxidoreductase [Paraglaciecola sp.]|uniref:SDR family oxidoreductase n=1 Tax=Paraglaciecola sp. TaxID=1920173 RepID=UPI003EF1C7EB
MQIAIIGCGWLGLPVAKHLKHSGHKIVATRRSTAGVAELNSHNLLGIEYTLGEPLDTTRLTPLFTSDILFLNIPVGRKSQACEDFLSNIETLLKFASHSNIQQVIFISTSSIYGDDTRIVTAKSAPNPVTESAKINLQIEKLVGRFFPQTSTILRLAGLVGNDRHPAKYLAGKSQLPNPNQVVNLVHQSDVVQAIDKIIADNIWGETFVLSATEHPTRKDYYTWAAERLELAAPNFIQQDSNANLGKRIGKRIDASDSIKTLGIKLKYPSPYDMIDAQP